MTDHDDTAATGQPGRPEAGYSGSDPVTDKVPVLSPPPQRAPQRDQPGGLFRQPTAPLPHPRQSWAQQPPQHHQPYPRGPVPAASQPATTYGERLRPHELVPPSKPVPGHGWRRVVYRATFGAVNPGLSPQERALAALEAAVRAPLRTRFKVGVMGKGGVGKTTVSACIGSILAELRQDDRVVAVDADTAFGKLGSRVDPRTQGSFWELAGDQHLDTFADVRHRLGSNAAGLFVLAGEATPARRRVLDPAIYREAVTHLDRYFTIAVVDCSSTMDSPVTQEVLQDLDALVVVSSPWIDGAAAAGQTLDWLAARGMTQLLQRTVVVLNDSDGHADKKTRMLLAQQFSGQGQLVVEVPFDGGLRPGGVIDGTAHMSRGAKLKLIEVCAVLTGFFPAQGNSARGWH